MLAQLNSQRSVLGLGVPKSKKRCDRHSIPGQYRVDHYVGDTYALRSQFSSDRFGEGPSRCVGGSEPREVSPSCRAYVCPIATIAPSPTSAIAGTRYSSAIVLT